MALRLQVNRAERWLRRGPAGRLAVTMLVAAGRVRRRRLDGALFVGITGSTGKTTAKELTYAVLACSGRGVATGQNLTSRVSLTVLRMRGRDGFCVAEVATAQPGDVRRIAGVVRPQIAAVTRIGSDHRTSFRTLEATAAEKQALVEALPPNGVAVLNADDPLVRAMAGAAPGRVVWFGESEDADLRAEDVAGSWPEPLRFTLVAAGERVSVATQLHGRHWLHAVLVALAVGEIAGVPRAEAVAAVATVAPRRGRMEPLPVEGVTFMGDDYKGSQDSLEPALAWLGDARARRKLAVVGTLSDLTGSSSAAYARAARRAVAVADEVLFVGPKAVHAEKAARAGGAPLRLFPGIEEAAAYLRETLQPGDLVLLKGTNRVDHLRRVALAYGEEIACWRERCGRFEFCETCALLRGPVTRRQPEAVRTKTGQA